MQNIRTLQLSREMWIFVGVTGLLSAVYLWNTTSERARMNAAPQEITPSQISPGQTVDVAITLISADGYGLSCASDQVVDSAHCGFTKEGDAWKQKGSESMKPEDIISPYMTVDNVLFLIPGLFTQPLLKKRLDDEPPGKFTREEMETRRFTTTCKMKVIEKMSNFKVRWAPNAPWGDRDTAWVGRVSDCKMTGGLRMSFSSALFRPGVFDGQVVLITGGGTGIGLSVAREVGSLGAKVVIASRSQDKVDAGLRTLAEDGTDALGQTCDIREADQCAALVTAALEKFGRVDVLVNNAGGQFPSPAEQLSPRGFDAVVRNNLSGTFYMTHAVANKAMIPQKRGRIVNVIADIARGFPGMVHTGAARAGVENMTKSLAIEWAHHGIKVNAVAPGTIVSSGTAQYGDALLEQARKATPAKRLGTPDEVSRVVVFLASHLNDYVTGSTYYIDGGSSLWGDIWSIEDHAPKPS